jgi:hypothetical protein
VVLGPARRVRLTLEHLRANVAQQVLAEHYAVSQPSISRVIAEPLPLIDEALEQFDHGLAEISPRESLIVDANPDPHWAQSHSGAALQRKTQDPRRELPSAVHPGRDASLGLAANARSRS